MTTGTRPALLLDRDGVINVDRRFVSCCQDFAWMPGIFEVARTAVRLAMPLVVVTNQSGIGLGYYSEADYQAVTAFMRDRFIQEGAPLAAAVSKGPWFTLPDSAKFMSHETTENRFVSRLYHQ